MGVSTNINILNDIEQIQATIDRVLEQWKDKLSYKLYQILKDLNAHIEQIVGEPLHIVIEAKDVAVIAELNRLFGQDKVVIDTHDNHISIKIAYEGNLLSEIFWLSIVSKPLKETIAEIFNPETYQQLGNVSLSKGLIQ